MVNSIRPPFAMSACCRNRLAPRRPVDGQPRDVGQRGCADRHDLQRAVGPGQVDHQRVEQRRSDDVLTRARIDRIEAHRGEEVPRRHLPEVVVPTQPARVGKVGRPGGRAHLGLGLPRLPGVAVQVGDVVARLVVQCPRPRLRRPVCRHPAVLQVPRQPGAGLGRHAFLTVGEPELGVPVGRNHRVLEHRLVGQRRGEAGEALGHRLGHDRVRVRAHHDVRLDQVLPDRQPTRRLVAPQQRRHHPVDPFRCEQDEQCVLGPEGVPQRERRVGARRLPDRVGVAAVVPPVLVEFGRVLQRVEQRRIEGDEVVVGRTGDRDPVETLVPGRGGGGLDLRGCRTVRDLAVESGPRLVDRDQRDTDPDPTEQA